MSRFLGYILPYIAFKILILKSMLSICLFLQTLAYVAGAATSETDQVEEVGIEDELWNKHCYVEDNI